MRAEIAKFKSETSREGFGKGRIDPLYQGVDDGVPLLSTFYFRFEQVGSPGAVDNHINSIMVLPAGTAEDLSPNADIPAPVVESGKISLIYQDAHQEDAKDRYFYKASHLIQSFGRPTHPLNSARRYQIRDVGCTGKCERVLPRPAGSGEGTFVLVGFQLFFTGGRDHHVDEIAVFEEDGELTVKLNDRDDRDVFGYVVDYALFAPTPTSIERITQMGEESGSAKGGARVTLPRGRKVIRGFHFNFKSGDHHLREIGVLLSNENLEVFYSDSNGDDLFDWGVRWAIIGSSTGPATEL